MLESALARPRKLFSDNANASLQALAASYAFGIARNHPFVDGNKRVALTLAATCLPLNGYELKPSSYLNGSPPEGWTSPNSPHGSSRTPKSCKRYSLHNYMI